MCLGILHAHRLAQRIGPAHEDAQFQLQIQLGGWCQNRLRRIGRLHLAQRPAKGGAAGQQRRGTPVVADRYPLVVGQQWILGPELSPDLGGVVDANVEVGVVPHLARQAQLHRGLCYQGRLEGCALAAALAQSVRQRLAQGAALLLRCLHQLVHVGMIHQACGAQVQHLVADRDAQAPGGFASQAKAPERQVLDRKVGARVIGRFHPAAQRRIVGCVEVCVHDDAPSSLACRKAACLGARLVLDQSSSMSHFTASSFLSMASSSGSGHASSTRWPLGSKK